jgi:hypothetical protein
VPLGKYFFLDAACLDVYNAALPFFLTTADFFTSMHAPEACGSFDD